MRQSDAAINRPSNAAWIGHVAMLLLGLGCLTSIVASGRVSVRLIVDGAISFAFVPAAEVAACAIVWARLGRGKPAFRATLGEFLDGNRPWLLWIAAVLAIAVVLPPRQSGEWLLPVLVTAIVPAVWSVRIDLRWFREGMGRTRRDAIRDVLMQRTIAWTIAIAYFLGIALWSETLPSAWMWLTR